MVENKVFKPSFRALIPTAIVFAFYFFIFKDASKVKFYASIHLIEILIGGFILVMILHFWSLKVKSYELQQDGLYIKKGIIAKKRILLLYPKIQDVTEYQNFIHKIIGLKTIQVKTMTLSSLKDGNLSDLKIKDADELRNLLLQVTSEPSKGSEKITTAKEVQFDIEKEHDMKAANPYPVNYYKLGLTYLGVFVLLFILGMVIIQSVRLISGIQNVISQQESSPIYMNLLIFSFILLSIPIQEFIKQITFRYWMGERTITIQSGLLNSQKTSIEIEKLQDIVISQNMFEAALGLASIHLETGSVEFGYGEHNKQQPNYNIGALKLSDAKILTGILNKKMGIDFVQNNEPLVSKIPLDRKKIIKRSILGSFVVTLFVLFAYPVVFFLGFGGAIADGNQELFKAMFNSASVVILIWIILIVLVVVYENFYYKRYYYDLSKNSLTIKKGVIGNSQVNLPFEKIQNIFKDQDLFDRIFGIYDVHLSTISNGSIRLCHIDGLSKENADKMVNIFSEKVKENIKK